MILTLLKEAGADLLLAVGLTIQWVACQFRHHDWYEYVNDWGDGDIEIEIECARCQAKP